MLQPPYLKPNNTIAIVAPAGKIAGELVDNAVQQLQQWGFQVKKGKYVGADYMGFAGTDDQRRADLQAAINDPDVAAILCARGGYGCGRIVYMIDFSPLWAHPKWLAGFSDITVLHARLQRMELQSIHGPMCKSFSDNAAGVKSITLLRQALCGELPEYVVPAHPLNRQGTARGILRGGNLSILANVAATPDDIEPDGAILFLEDIGEYSYHIDRMMNNLLRSGKLNSLAGVLVGDFTNIKADAIMPGSAACDILAAYLNPLNIPVCYGFPAGHDEPNYALYFGRETVLDVATEACRINFM
jgi:muramoyltetrapeptide carboxypeptidase